MSILQLSSTTGFLQPTVPNKFDEWNVNRLAGIHVDNRRNLSRTLTQEPCPFMPMEEFGRMLQKFFTEHCTSTSIVQLIDRMEGDVWEDVLSNIAVHVPYDDETVHLRLRGQMGELAFRCLLQKFLTTLKREHVTHMEAKDGSIVESKGGALRFFGQSNIVLYRSLEDAQSNQNAVEEVDAILLAGFPTQRIITLDVTTDETLLPKKNYKDLRHRNAVSRILSSESKDSPSIEKIHVVLTYPSSQHAAYEAVSNSTGTIMKGFHIIYVPCMHAIDTCYKAAKRNYWRLNTLHGFRYELSQGNEDNDDRFTVY